MIYLDCGSLNLIGDALAAVPYIAHLAKKHGRAVIVDGFCQTVRPLLPTDEMDIYFADRRIVPDGEPIKRLDISEVFSFCHAAGKNYHMAQGWFLCGGDEPPEVPITLPLIANPADLSRLKAVIIAPFSRSDHENNKLWPLDRWVAVGRSILKDRLSREIIVVGASKEEWEVFACQGFGLWKGEPLRRVLGLLRDAALVMTVDNGISHLCHFGGVSAHFLLQPECLTQAFVANPRGRSVRGDPKSIGIDAVLGPVMEMLR